MSDQSRPLRGPLYLGIEAGGTRTVALLSEWNGRYSRQTEAGPANIRLLDGDQLYRHFRHIARALPTPNAMAIGMAGARTEADRKRIRAAAARVWPGVPCHATNDLETALSAADAPKQSRITPAAITRHRSRPRGERHRLLLFLAAPGTAGPPRSVGGDTSWATGVVATKSACGRSRRWCTTSIGMVSGLRSGGVCSGPCS